MNNTLLMIAEWKKFLRSKTFKEQADFIEATGGKRGAARNAFYEVFKAAWKSKALTPKRINRRSKQALNKQ